jgi:hypothetical protein
MLRCAGADVPLAGVREDDGSLVFKSRVPIEIGALLMEALDAAMKEDQRAPPGI